MTATIEPTISALAPPTLEDIRARTLRVQAANIPDALKQRRQWGVWRWEHDEDGKPTKIPYIAGATKRASHSGPRTWRDFEEALAAYDAGGWDGINYFFSADDPFCGWDFDHCRNPETGEIAEWAAGPISTFNSYAEASPTGTGAKLITEATHYAGCRKRTSPGAEHNFETYVEKRLFTITGHRLPEAPTTIEPRQVEHDQLHRAVFGYPPAATAPAAPAMPVGVDDAVLLQRARSATNGAKFDRLWNGDTSDHGGDDSAADLALCNLLAFWTGRDVARIDGLFRQSALMRAKWDTKRNGSTYGGITIEKAIQSCRNFYSAPEDVCPLYIEGKPVWTPPGSTPPETLSTHDDLSAPDTTLPPELEEADLPEAALAYIRQLQQEKAGLQRQVQVLQVRVGELQEHFRLERQIFARPDLDPATKLTGIAIADEMAKRRRDGKVDGDTTWIPNACLAARTGLSEKRTNSHAQVLAASGYCDREVVRVPMKHTDEETGEITTRIRQEQHLTLAAESSTTALRLLARAQPAEPRDHGGKREPGQGHRCQDHPDADRYTLQTTYCGICHKPLDSGRKELGPIPEGLATNDADGAPADASDLLRPAPEHATDEDLILDAASDGKPVSDTDEKVGLFSTLRDQEDPSKNVSDMWGQDDLSASSADTSDGPGHGAKEDAEWSG